MTLEESRVALGSRREGSHIKERPRGDGLRIGRGGRGAMRQGRSTLGRGAGSGGIGGSGW